MAAKKNNKQHVSSEPFASNHSGPESQISDAVASSTKDTTTRKSKSGLFGANWTYSVQFYEETKKKITVDSGCLSTLTKKIGSNEIIGLVWAYKVPLFTEQLFQSMWYHMYVLFETKQWWWSIEKHSDVITIQRSRKATNVKEVCKQKSRIKGQRRMLRGRGTCSVNELLDWLHGQLNKKYNLMRRNCQHFATDVFIKLTDAWRESTEIKEFFAILVNRSEESSDSETSFSSKSGSEFQSTTYADLRTGTNFYLEASSTKVPNDEDTHDTHDEHDDMGLLNLNEIVQEISEESESLGLDGIDVTMTSFYLEDASTPVPNDEHDTHDEHDDMELLNLNKIVQKTTEDIEEYPCKIDNITLKGAISRHSFVKSTPGSFTSKCGNDMPSGNDDETTGDVQSIPDRADERTEQRTGNMASSKMFNSVLDMDAAVALLEELKYKSHKFRKKTLDLAASLDEVAKVFNKAFLDVKKATIAGSTVGVVGGTMGVVGLVLGPFTAGLSLLVSVAGAGVGALGGITTGGAAIGKAVERNNAVHKAKEIIKQFERDRYDVIKNCKQITDLFGEEDLDKDFPLCASFITKLIVGSSTIAWSVALEALNGIVSGIRLGTAISEFSLGAVVARPGVATTALQAGSAAARGLNVVAMGMVVGIILIPLDIGFLVHSAHAVATDKVPDTSKKISETANQLRASCPSEAEIDDAIYETINKLIW